MFKIKMDKNCKKEDEGIGDMRNEEIEMNKNHLKVHLDI